MTRMLEGIYDLWERHVFGRRRYQAIFHRLHRVALVGLNYGLDDPERNGENALLDRLAGGWPPDPVVLDAGGFRGEWSNAVLDRAPGARVFVFEPNGDSFERIRARLGDRATVVPLALGADDGTASLSAPPGLPEMGSLHRRDLDRFGLAADEIGSVQVTTVDSFCAEHAIDHIDMLKLDVEGHELAALRGAARMLERGAIDAVQFEFGGAALDARVFLRDLIGALDGYDVSRIVRDGLDPVDPYDERAEVFTLSNFVALRSGPAG